MKITRWQSWPTMAYWDLRQEWFSLVSPSYQELKPGTFEFKVNYLSLSYSPYIQTKDITKLNYKIMAEYKYHHHLNFHKDLWRFFYFWNNISETLKTAFSKSIKYYCNLLPNLERGFFSPAYVKGLFWEEKKTGRGSTGYITFSSRKKAAV